MSAPVLLAIDPGLRAMGWAAVAVTASGPLLLDVGLVRTKVRDGPVGLDRVRCAQELWAGLMLAQRRYGPVLICAEQPGGMKSAIACATVNLAWGVTIAFAASLGLPLFTVTPAHVKRCAAGNNNASKIEVLEAVCRTPGFGQLPRMLGAIGASVKRRKDGSRADGIWEHPADACAVALASLGNMDVQEIMAGEAA